MDEKIISLCVIQWESSFAWVKFVRIIALNLLKIKGENPVKTLLSPLMQTFSVLLVFMVSSLPAGASPQAKPLPLSVVVTIPPLAGMIAPLLEPEDRIEVLLKEGESPHGFALRPSHLKTLKNADALLMVGSPVDAWVHKSVERMQNKTINMAELANLQKLPIRKGGLWEKKLPKREGHEHDGHKHSAMSYDGHLWMSIHNAKQMIGAFSEKLMELRPDQAQSIQHNTQNWLAKIAQTENLVNQQLKPNRHTPFMVLHDAFQYFEQHFELNGVGSIRLNPELQPSVKRLLTLRKKLKSENVQCIFKEPQFPDKQILKLAENTSVTVGELDPMGYVYAQKSQAGFVNFDVFISSLGESFLQCFQEKASGR